MQISNTTYMQMEKCVLGKIIGYQSTQILEDVVQMGLSSDMFTVGIGSIVFDSVCSLWDEQVKPDFLYTSKRATEKSDYKDSEISEYLYQCLDLANQTTDYNGYVSAIIEGYANRKTTDKLNELLVNHSDMDTVVNEVNKLADELENKRSGIGATDPKDDYELFINSYHNARTKGGNILPTGLKDFDKMLGGGFAKGGMTVICARTGEGKSALMLNLAHRLAKAGNPILYITVEMTRESIWFRRVSMESDISYSFLENRATMLSEEEDDKIERIASDLSNHPFHMNPVERLTVNDIYRQAMSVKDLAAIFIDYLQIINPEKGAMDDVQGVADVSHSIRALAIKLKIPIVTAAQFNRGINERDSEGKQVKPSMRNLKGSSAIEQDSHAVVIVSRADYDLNDEDEIDESQRNIMQCTVHKNRTGKQYASCKLKCKMSVNQFWSTRSDDEGGSSGYDVSYGGYGDDFDDVSPKRSESSSRDDKYKNKATERYGNSSPASKNISVSDDELMFDFDDGGLPF